MFPSKQNQNKSSIDKLFERSNISKTYRKGQYIYQEGEVARGIFRVQKGRVKLWKLGSSFTRSLVLYFVHPCEPFGIIDFFRKGKTRRCSATAMDNEVTVQFIHLSEFEKSVFRDTEFRQDIFKFLTISEQINFEKYSGLQSDNMDERVFLALQKLAKTKGVLSKDGIQLPNITHQDLSDYIGISRQSVTFSFNNLRGKGLIVYDRKHIIIKRDS